MSDTDYNDAEKLKADLYAVLCERNEMATEITELRTADKSRVAVHEAEIRRLGIAMGVQADEIERLRVVLQSRLDAYIIQVAELQDEIARLKEESRVVLLHVADLRAENERLLADKDVQRSQARNASR